VDVRGPVRACPQLGRGMDDGGDRRCGNWKQPAYANAFVPGIAKRRVELAGPRPGCHAVEWQSGAVGGTHACRSAFECATASR
jgi:hypothetical protein